MKVKITYTQEEAAQFEHIRTELLQSISGAKIHTSTAPGGVRVWYLTKRRLDNKPESR